MPCVSSCCPYPSCPRFRSFRLAVMSGCGTGPAGSTTVIGRRRSGRSRGRAARRWRATSWTIPTSVGGRDVFDLGTGSGLVAIAAAKAGARSVRASDTDPDAIAAVDRNARANGVEVIGVVGDALDNDRGRAGRSGRRPVLRPDDDQPGHAISPARRRLRALRRWSVTLDAASCCLTASTNSPAYDVPVRSIVEDTTTMRATIWQLSATSRTAGHR